MTIHVNIGEAKTRFSELAARALRGEEVVVQKAGVPMLRLVPIQEAKAIDRVARRKRVDAILARIDALPVDETWTDPLRWDENGLPL
jgi:antitoxin (DNA-binding transcriptional repressor) of toxin-antitoxin stability system